jgi:hypothetical protein
MTRRLIEQQHGRVLSDGQRDPDALAFAAGEFSERAVAQPADLGAFDGRLDGAPIVGQRRPAPPRSIREASAGNDIGDRHAVGQRPVGLDERDGAAAFARPQGTDGTPRHDDRAGLDGARPGDRPQ